MVYQYIPSEKQHKLTVLHGDNVPPIGSRHQVHGDCGPIEERLVTATRDAVDGRGNPVTVIEYRTEIHTCARWADDLRRSRPDATVIVWD